MTNQILRSDICQTALFQLSAYAVWGSHTNSKGPLKLSSKDTSLDIFDTKTKQSGFAQSREQLLMLLSLARSEPELATQRRHQLMAIGF